MELAADSARARPRISRNIFPANAGDLRLPLLLLVPDRVDPAERGANRGGLPRNRKKVDREIPSFHPQTKTPRNTRGF